MNTYEYYEQLFIEKAGTWMDKDTFIETMLELDKGCEKPEESKTQPKIFGITLRVAKKAMLFIDISLSVNDFLWWNEDAGIKYKHLFQFGFVESKKHKYVLQLIILNAKVIFAVARQASLNQTRK